jgi:hypothetical protein
LAQHNPPSWPDSVQVFGPETSLADIQAKVEAAFAINGGHIPEDKGQFSEHRFAFLFKPGSYAVDVPVGYYTQVAGLGKLPADVKFTGSKGVYSDEGSYTVKVGALNSFWRAAENFETHADYPWISSRGTGMLWAGSQAAPLRKVHVKNDLFLYVYRDGETKGDFSSGGFMANSIVDGIVASGSQQQWMTRNSEVGSWPDGVWNMVFVGTKGSPPSHCGMKAELCSHAISTVDSTPKIAEKPFVSIDKSGKYALNVPQVASDRVGADFDGGLEIGFENVYVADAEKDTAASINAALSQGMHAVLSPGIYNLEASLELKSAGQVLLGLGFPTLVAASGKPAVLVGDVSGVRVAGVLLQAGKLQTSSLLQWGNGSSNYAGDAKDPGFLHDVFMRVGGPAAATDTQVDVMLQINSGNVIGDNLWLWRADHVEGGGLVKNGDNPCQHGAVVDGDDVTMYGLAAEHTLQDIVQWNGDRGAVYFFQSELPYDVTQDFADKGNVGYRVGDQVTEHVAIGVGVYHYFRDYPVTLPTGIVAPKALEASFVAPFASFLNGLGVMQHVINDKGDVTKKGDNDDAVVYWVCPDAPSRFNFLSGSQPHCNVGDDVICPSSGTGCKGNTCCSDGSTCPSAQNDFGCCPKPKEEDCTTGPTPPPSPPSPPGPSPPGPSPPGPSPPGPSPPGPSPPGPSPPSPASCNVGDTVYCSGSSGAQCSGDQCCPGGVTCPSAESSYTGCPSPKVEDCTGSGWRVVV